MAERIDCQRRHFKLIADVIRGLRTKIGPLERDRVAVEFADKLEAASASFDRRRFLKACGVPFIE